MQPGSWLFDSIKIPPLDPSVDFLRSPGQAEFQIQRLSVAESDRRPIREITPHHGERKEAVQGLIVLPELLDKGIDRCRKVPLFKLMTRVFMRV